VIQDEDVKFELYRAAFTPGASGSVSIVNQSVENLRLSSVSGMFEHVGETINGETRLTFSGLSGSPANTYIVKGATSGANGQIVKVSSGTYNVRGVLPSFAYQVGEAVSFKFANGAATAVSGTVATTTIPSGTLFKFLNVTSANSSAQLVGSSGTFTVGEEIRGRTSNTSGIISQVLDFKYDVIDVESSVIELAGTSVSWNLKATANNYTLDSSATGITRSNNYYTPKESLVVSGSNENVQMSGAKSLVVGATLTTANEYVSPIIDLNRTYAALVHNIVNNVSTGENSSHGGSAINKYISRKVTLADGQDAEDLKVYLTAYKPASTDIKVYVKLLHGEDSSVFSDIAWLEMGLDSKNVFSSTANKVDLKDYTYVLPAAVLTGGNGEVQYVSAAGVTFTGYKYFAIKVVLLASDSTSVPRVQDLRAIALQI
jgi:hypothetical protein